MAFADAMLMLRQHVDDATFHDAGLRAAATDHRFQLFLQGLQARNAACHGFQVLACQRINLGARLTAAAQRDSAVRGLRRLRTTIRAHGG